MSGIIKSAIRFPSLKQAGKLLSRSTSATNATKIQACRSVWHLSSINSRGLDHKCNSSNFCSLRKVHSLGGNFRSKAATEVAGGVSHSLTQGEKELADFLVEEITAERKLQKVKKIPSELDGFKIKLEGSEVSLIKTVGGETIEVNWNINHTVDTDPVEPDLEPTMDKAELGEMKSRPSFEVEIRRDGQTLGFTCSTVSPSTQQQSQQDDSYNDLFMIDEVVMYQGEWKDSNYSVSGEVLDGTLYDLFMNLLEDKGITNEFVDKLIEFSTAYEHDSYVRMLEDIQRFVTPRK